MVKRAFLVMAGTEVVSLLAFVYPFLSLPFLAVVGILAFLLAFRRAEWGAYLVFGELFFGSRGHLLEYNFGAVSLSLRLVVFVAVLLAWLLRTIRRPDALVRQISLLPGLYWALLLVVGVGVAAGLLKGHGLTEVFLDANNYLYFLIWLPVLAGLKDDGVKENIFKILAAAIIIIAAKTFLLFLWFSGGFWGIATLYQWVIQQDIGEITGEVGSASRIFMQSQFYALVGFFIFGLGAKPWGRNWWLVALSLLAVVMSLSRSFWLGALAGLAFAVPMLLFYYRVALREVAKLAGVLVLLIAVEVGAIYVLANFRSVGFSSSVSSRLSSPVQEAAGSARLLLLPELLNRIRESPVFGQGFGTAVTYKSYLPDRISPENPDGEVTTTAFEWGYLDIILKIGLLGFLVYALLLARFFQQGWQSLKRAEPFDKNFGLLAGLVALAVLNITTPYLNHPLGIGYLLLLVAQFSGPLHPDSKEAL